MNYKFYLTIFSDLDYEELVSDINRAYCENKACTIATISRENGIDNMDIELFFSPRSRHYFKFPFDDFLRIIDKAKEALSYPPRNTSEDEEHSEENNI